MLPGLSIAPAVAELLAPVGLAQLDQLRDHRYVCPFCRVESPLSARHPANVVLLTDALPGHRGGTPARLTLCRFAHPTCSPSRVITIPIEDLIESLSPELTLTTSVWIRPHFCQPSTVLLCRTLAHAYTPSEHHTGPEGANIGGGQIDYSAVRELAEAGFTRLTSLEDPFTFLEDLDARIIGDQLTITGPTSPDTLVTCTLLPAENAVTADGQRLHGPPWYQPALTEGRLGVVLLVGANPDPDINALPELEAAIHDRRAVGATTRIVAEVALSAARDTGTQPQSRHHPNTHPRPTEHQFKRAA